MGKQHEVEGRRLLSARLGILGLGRARDQIASAIAIPVCRRRRQLLRAMHVCLQLCGATGNAYWGVWGCMGAESSGMLGRAAGKIRPEGGPVGYRTD